MSKSPKISVIIPAFNESKYIHNVISGLRSQTFKDFEVIVVDGKSKDNTRQIARRFAKVLIEPKPNIGAARNTGAKQAKGDIIFFTNADTKATKNLLKIYADLFSDKNIVAASGPLTPLEKTTRFIRFGYNFASVRLAKFSFGIGQPAISGSNFAVRRSTFIKCGGFDESLFTYEDLDLTLRLKKFGKIEYVDNAVVATSTRRIVKWGVVRYILFNAGNVLRYNLFHKSKSDYEPLR